jgi:serine O-acetyltransferase
MSIKEDIAAAQGNDPAAPSALTVFINYSGVHAIWGYRFNHWLWTHHCRGLARWLSQMARHFTGVEIHPGATIGKRFFIDHGMGVVIGETTIIGNDCQLYQGVTLGGTGKETGKRHPTLENNVVVGVGASVLGDITIGENSKVGGGAVVVDDVPPNCTVVGIPGHIVRHAGKRIGASGAAALRHEDLPDPIVDTIEALERRIEQLENRLIMLSECPASMKINELNERLKKEQQERKSSELQIQKD